MSYLTHHGILGMKWGVRRFQNKDGTLTPEGKQRYQNMFDRVAPSTLKENRLRNKEQERQKLRSFGLRSDNTISKGSKLYRVADSGEPIDKKRKYVTLSPYDVRTYRDYAFEGALGLKDPNNAEVYAYKAKKDLKVVDAEKLSNYMLDKYASKDISKARAIIDSMKDLDMLTDYRIKISDLSEKDKKFALNVNKRYEESQKLVDNCVGAIGRKSILSKAINDFSKLGYDAMVDLEDVGIANYPMILFNPEYSVGLASKTSANRPIWEILPNYFNSKGENSK